MECEGRLHGSLSIIQMIVYSVQSCYNVATMTNAAKDRARDTTAGRTCMRIRPSPTMDSSIYTIY